MFISVLARRLKPGKTYDDFINAWYPDKGFGMPMRGPVLARNLDDPDEILAIGFIDIDGRDKLAEGMTRVAAQEAARHDRIAEVIESTTFKGIYEVADEFDFSTDASVAEERPKGG